ncbi:MAG: hypothetical protein LBR26_07275 [Prevotella sp.]|jgi:hypothetical protein|nr:hypothetical protein [Prevotella sp.]
MRFGVWGNSFFYEVVLSRKPSGNMVADFYGVDERTIKRYLESHEQELKHNGYFLCRGKLLKELKLQFGSVINAPTKTTVIGLFNFRSF